METPRELAALVSSLVSQALLLLLFPAGTAAAATSLLLFPHSTPPPNSLFPFLLHLLSSQIAATAAAASPRPRKRKRHLESDASDQSPIAAELPIITAVPDHFHLCFRMSSSTFEWLSGLLEPLLDCCDSPGPLLRPSSRLAIGLFRLATGCPYQDLAHRFAVPESAARFCTKRLCRVLCTNFRFWLAFPSSPADLHSISSSFEAIPGGGLPDCCGAIVSARFKIFDDTDVIAQVVSEPRSRILSIATGYRGGKNSYCRALRCSSLYRDVEAGRLLGPPSYLVGGDGFPLLPWLMVPFADPLIGTKKQHFNSLHNSMLQPALRTVSSLRNWGILSHPMVDEERKMAVACIGTCAILHNVMLMREDYSALSCGIGENVLGEESAVDDYLEFPGSGETIVAKEAADLRSLLAERAREMRETNRFRDHQ